MSKFLLKEIFDETFGAGWDDDTIHGASLNALYDAITGGAIEHGWLSGRGDDDHSQYALLAGRAGGQTLIGGTAASESLTLKGTSHATPGLLDFQSSARLPDNLKMLFGTGSDAAIYYTGTNLVIDPHEVGAGDLVLSPNAGANVTMFEGAAAGNTRELRLGGYRTADALRFLEIGVGIDAADTASFDGLSNYLFDGTIKPVGSIIFQTAATSLDLATNGAYFLPRRLSQEAQPTPASGELLIWHKPTGNRVRLTYNDPTVGVIAVQMI